MRRSASPPPAPPAGTSLHGRIVQASATIALFTVLGMASLMANQIVLAGLFGARDLMDAYLVGFLVPVLLVQLVTGSLSASFIPAYQKALHREGREAALGVTGSLLTLVLLGYLALALILWASLPAYLRLLTTGFSPEKVALTRRLSLWAIGSMVPYGLAGFLGGVLNAQERFALTASGQTVATLPVIALALAFWKPLGIFAPAVGRLLGAVAQAGAFAVGVVRTRVPLKPRFDPAAPALRALLAQLVPLLVGGVFGHVSIALESALAAMLPSGSVAVLNYGSRLVDAVVTIAAFALADAALPFFSQQASRGDRPGIEETVHRIVPAMAWLALPATFYLLSLATPLVAVLYRRGAFRPEDVSAVARVLRISCLQILPIGVGLVGSRLLSASGRNQILMVILFLNLLFKLVVSLALLPVLGLAAVPLSTVLTFVFSTVLIYRALFHIHGIGIGRDAWRSIGGIAAVGAPIGLGLWALSLRLPPVPMVALGTAVVGGWVTIKGFRSPQLAPLLDRLLGRFLPFARRSDD